MKVIVIGRVCVAVVVVCACLLSLVAVCFEIEGIGRAGALFGSSCKCVFREVQNEKNA